MTIQDIISMNDLKWITTAMTFLGIIVFMFLVTRKLEEPGTGGSDMITRAFLNLHERESAGYMAEIAKLHKQIDLLQRELADRNQIEDMIEHAERTDNRSDP